MHLIGCLQSSYSFCLNIFTELYQQEKSSSRYHLQSNCNFVGLHLDGNQYIKGYEIDQVGAEILNFQDTAEIISNLDLVISVDSANVHLAGSMDIPCWVLMPKLNLDWRWYLEEECSYWYNSVRIFKQKEYDDWRYPIKCVKSELEKLLSQ